MQKVATHNQKLFDLHLEYVAAADTAEQDYRKLEHKFVLAFGYPPILPGDAAFAQFSDKSQKQCAAFWESPVVKGARQKMLLSRILSETYFNAFADTQRH